MGKILSNIRKAFSCNVIVFTDSWIIEVDTEKKHRHHKKHKHKKHKKHRRLKEINEPDEASTEQEIELDQTEYNMDIIGEAVTIPHDEQQFLMDAEHCEVWQIWCAQYYSYSFSPSFYFRELWKSLKSS